MCFLTFNLCMRQSGVDARLGDRNVCVVCLFAGMCWRGLQTMVHSRLLARRAVWHTHISLGTRCCKDSVLKQFAGDITMGVSAACETYSRLRARHVKYHIARTTCYTHVVTTSACLTSGRRLLYTCRDCGGTRHNRSNCSTINRPQPQKQQTASAPQVPWDPPLRVQRY